MDRWIDVQIERQIDRQKDRQIDRKTDLRQIDRQIDRKQIDRYKDRQIDRQMARQNRQKGRCNKGDKDVKVAYCNWGIPGTLVLCFNPHEQSIFCTDVRSHVVLLKGPKRSQTFNRLPLWIPLAFRQFEHSLRWTWFLIYPSQLVIKEICSPQPGP